MTRLRVYEPDIDAFTADGYPMAWSVGDPPVKDLVREQADNRCVRCAHPYAKGDGEWSPCDELCTHGAPIRWRDGDGPWLSEDHTPRAGVGVARGWTVEARWRVLTVHHLNGVKGDLRWWNLAALCQRCHLTVQGRVVMDRVWPWEHSDWFKPYAAGWYAATYLGQDLTRDETLARLDDLLALERIA